MLIILELMKFLLCLGIVVVCKGVEINFLSFLNCLFLGFIVGNRVFLGLGFGLGISVLRFWVILM